MGVPLSRKAPYLALLVLGGLVLQTSLLPFLRVDALRPDLLLALAVSAGLVFGPPEALVTGLFAGFLLDLLVGHHLGLFALAEGGAGYLVGLAGQKVQKDHLLGPALASFVATFLLWSLLALLLNLTGTSVGWPLAVHNVFLSAWYNALLGLLANWFVVRVARRIERDANPLARPGRTLVGPLG